MERFQLLDELAKFYIQTILRGNSEKNFVQRIMNPEGSPALPLANGRMGTHMMSYTDNPAGAMVYPEIIQRNEGDLLERLSRDDAVKYARDTGQYIQFDKPSDADWFGKNYKRVWSK